MPDSTPSPEGATKRLRRKEARPGELLEAALGLFVEKGFAATRVEQVAARAGVSKGTLFIYFPSKEELFKAVVRENAGRHLAEGMREVDGFTGTSAELIRLFMQRWWTQYGGTPAAGLTKLIMSEAANFPELADYYQREVVRPSHELIGRILRRGVVRKELRAVDLTVAAQLVIAPLLQLVMWRFSISPSVTQQAPDPKAVLDLHADLIIRGLALAPAPATA